MAGRGIGMKVARIFVFVLLLTAPCYAQNGDTDISDQAYLKELTRLVTALQKNAWSGWKTGTGITYTYVADSRAAGAPGVIGLLPDEVYRVVEADKRLVKRWVVDVKAPQEKILIKDQRSSVPTGYSTKEEMASYLEIDGRKVACKLSEGSSINNFYMFSYSYE